MRKTELLSRFRLDGKVAIIDINEIQDLSIKGIFRGCTTSFSISFH